jgi:hypothetical protein
VAPELDADLDPEYAWPLPTFPTIPVDRESEVEIESEVEFEPNALKLLSAMELIGMAERDEIAAAIATIKIRFFIRSLLYSQ